jgi:tetratricopeptide (TPR) repeat protein
LLATDVLVNAEKLKDETDLDPLGQSLLLETITNSLIALHEYELALPVSESRSEICIEAFGLLAPESLRARVRQADCIQLCGRRSDSYYFRDEIGEDLRKTYGQGHIEYTRHNIAMGKLFLARKGWRRAVGNLAVGCESLEKFIGKDDPERIEALHALAEATHGFKAYEQCAKVREQLYDHYLRINGAKDQVTIETKKELGHAYIYNKNIETGIAYIKECIQQIKTEHPDDKVWISSTMDSLTLGYMNANLVDEEIKTRSELLEYNRVSFGKGHPYDVYATVSLAVAYRRNNQSEKFESLIESINIDHSKNDTWTPHAVGRLSYAASSLFRVDRNEEALKLWNVVVDSRRRLLGNSSILTIQSEGNVALATFCSGEIPSGLNLLTELVNRGGDQVGNRNLSVRHIRGNWHYMVRKSLERLPRMIADGELESAEEILRLLIQYKGEKEEEYVEESYELLHSLLLEQNQFEQAQLIVDLWTKFLIENNGFAYDVYGDPEIVKARPHALNMKLLAWAQTSKANCQLGLRDYQSAQASATDALTNEFISTANQCRCEVIIAMCLAENGKVDEAKKSAIAAFEKFEPQFDNAPINLLWFYTDMCKNIIRICETSEDSAGVMQWRTKLTEFETKIDKLKRKFVRRTPVPRL